MKFDLENKFNSKEEIVNYYKNELEYIINLRVPDKLYDIKDKNWSWQGIAMSNKTKNKIIYNINLRIKQLTN